MQQSILGVDMDGLFNLVEPRDLVRVGWTCHASLEAVNNLLRHMEEQLYHVHEKWSRHGQDHYYVAKTDQGPRMLVFKDPCPRAG